MSSSKGQGGRGPTTRSMSHVSAGGKVVKPPSRSRAPASPAPKATTSSNQSRPGSSSQQSATSIPASQTAESSTTNDADNRLRKEAGDLLVKLIGMHKDELRAFERYQSEVPSRTNEASKKVTESKAKLEEDKQKADDACAKEITNALMGRGPNQANIRSFLMANHTEKLQKARESRKNISFAQTELDLITIRADAYRDLCVLRKNIAQCTKWLTNLLDGKVQLQKEDFNAQEYLMMIKTISGRLVDLSNAKITMESKMMELEVATEARHDGTGPRKWLLSSHQSEALILARHDLKIINKKLISATSDDCANLVRNTSPAVNRMETVFKFLQDITKSR